LLRPPVFYGPRVGCLLFAYWWSMIFSENRCPLFGIML
jgi:hypothetical protein